MPYDDEIIIRSGNLRQFLAYKVGAHNLRGWWIVAAVAVVAFGLGKLL